MDRVVERLLASDEPSVVWRVSVDVLGRTRRSAKVRALQEAVRASRRVKALLGERDADGRIPFGVYAKWHGAHWVFAALADLGYPPGDESLAPLRDQVCACWLSPRHVRGVPAIAGRARCHASQEGNALYAMLSLGLADERADRLVENLMGWRWPDGGWNCDKRPEADTSSFHETWIPMRALALYARVRRSARAAQAVERAAEVFLSRRLFRRRRDGQVIHPRFLLLRYPAYWQYDILRGLKVMSEAGFIGDPRCAEALDALQSKRLPDGGFAAEERLYHTRDAKAASGRYMTGRSTVDWGPTGRRRMNEFVTADALSVLRAAERA